MLATAVVLLRSLWVFQLIVVQPVRRSGAGAGSASACDRAGAPPLVCDEAGAGSSATLDTVIGPVDSFLTSVPQADCFGPTASSHTGAGSSANSTSTISSAT